ncbi:MAG: alpha/beta hydrolase-fold protein [Kofleriaceae bacterium]
MPIHRHRITSQVLVGNPLGDPVERELYVYVPPGYDETPDERFPALLALVGFTGAGSYLFNPDPLGEPLDQRLDRLIASGACPPVIVVAPDCFTRVGGSQYINSLGTGRYQDYLVDEIVPFVDSHYGTLGRGRWGAFGKSSGGFGALLLGMHHPDRFGAVADHSGDAGFELTYLRDFPAALDAYRAAGGPAAWLAQFWRDPNRHRTTHAMPLEILGLAACYSPNPAAPAADAHIDWPFELATGAFVPAVWERWRAWDPVNLVPRYADALRRLKAVYVDAGTADEYALHWGARSLVHQLRAHGVTVRHDEFDDGHFNIGYRAEVSVPFLARALLAA